MDVPALQRALAGTEARPLLVDARLVRRVIKRHRHLPGVGLQVPHARCYAISRDELLAIVEPDELGAAAADLPERVILLPRPEPDELAGRSPAAVLADAWRYAFHARVHQEIDRLAAAGALTEARVRERIHRIGQTEFDEIRLVLRQDRLLLPPRDDLGTYTEFAALYLELKSFAPHLLGEIFPTLSAPGAVDAAVAEDIDVARLLAATRPEGASLPEPVVAAPPAEAEDDGGEDEPSSPLSRLEADAFRGLADAARAQGNLARSALLRARAGALGEAGADVEALANRLDRVLRPASHADGAGGGIDVPGWKAALLGLTARSAARGGLFRRVEARLLYDVQAACLAGEKAIGKVDLVSWMLSLGRRPLARLLPATRQIRVARELQSAVHKVPRVTLPEPERARLRDLVGDARRRADEALRDELSPVIVASLREVGFRPANVPERAALGKIVAELLDQATAHGHLGLGQLRDAVSRNQLKIPDVLGVGEIAGEDALLAADRRLADTIDGVHRRGEIYLRALQKMSSLLFGTGAGRGLTFYVLLPVGGSYMVPFATGLIITEVAHLLGLWHHPHQELELVPKPNALLSASPHELWPLPLLALLIFGLLHSSQVRAGALRVVQGVGFLLSLIFVRAPRFLLSLTVVRWLLKSRPALAFGRFVLKPGVIAAAVVQGTPLQREASSIRLAVFAAVFAAASLALNSRAGILAEEMALDALMRTAGQLQRHFLPGLFRLVVAFFRRVTDAFDRAIYAVDEWLRFREGQRRPALAAKAALGLVWFAVAYVLRIYVNLLLEPTFNPIKHFPTVTVAAKIMLPIDKELIHAIVHLLRPKVGLVAGGLLAWLVAGSLPGFFGFLVWELKENYKLYRATRPATLRPVAIGHHGETMGGLLKPGLHSGTLPKLWAKLRRAARKGDASVEKHREAMREIEEAVERFVDRELSAVLAESDRWEGAVHVHRVLLASNRVRVELGWEGAPAGGTCAVSFEEQSGWLVAGVPQAGWVATLSEDARVLFENALAGLYHRAGVDLVREQVEAALPGTTLYDIADEGLVAWPPGFVTEVVYDLAAKPALKGRICGDAGGVAPPPPIARSAILFQEQPITWKGWVDAWSGAPARLLKGAPILPARG